MKRSDSPRKKELLKELSGLGNLIRGSLVLGHRKCGKPGCACAKGGEGHPYHYLSISTTHARNRIVYVSGAQLKAVEEGVIAYRRAWEILEELSELNLAATKSKGKARHSETRGCEQDVTAN